MSGADSVKSLSGQVSTVERLSTVSGRVNDGYGSVNTKVRTSFRVNGKPAVYNGSPSLSSGDQITVIGFYQGGLFQVDILWNKTVGLISGGISDERTLGIYLLGGLLVGLGSAYLLSVFSGAITALLTLNLRLVVGEDLLSILVSGIFLVVGAIMIRNRYQKVRKIHQILGDKGKLPFL